MGTVLAVNCRCRGTDQDAMAAENRLLRGSAPVSIVFYPQFSRTAIAAPTRLVVLAQAAGAEKYMPQLQILTAVILVVRVAANEARIFVTGGHRPRRAGI
jgi:hypothetical protein